MCGRFTLTTSKDELEERYQAIVQFDYRPRYNIAPGQLIAAVISDGEKKRIGQLKWGLIPFWAKDEKIGYKMINAKCETLHEKPAFKHLLVRKRCLIPADGFYEWAKTGGKKQPYRVTLKSQGIFSMAGLYDTWVSPNGEKISSCTIITTEPNELMSPIHSRMPVILDPEEEETWLNRDMDDPLLIRSLLDPHPSEAMTMYAVSNDVGNVKNDYPALIQPLLN
jgi:putative SOS response-associated peptidase YedK